jgi:hypothetical protein
MGFLGEGVYRSVGGGNPFLPWSDNGWFNFSEGFKARGGLIKPIYRAEGGGVPARGIDTVPTMLSPGEYVVKNSSVSKAGLGVMEALNRGDLGAAARSLGARFSNSWNNSRSYSRVVNNNQKSVYNQVLVNNRTRAGRLNSYYSLANRLASSF